MERLPAPPPPPPPPAEPVASAEPTPYAARFRFLLGALLGIALASAIVTVGILGGSAQRHVSTRWSVWKPSDSSAKGAQQIADHISPSYRLSSGKQLVAISGGPLKIADLDVTIALRPASTQGSIDLVQGRGVLYTLSGLGPNGSIADGRPSVARGLLLRREALELALYSFRYLDGVKNVVALLPPPKGQKKNTAVLIQSSQVGGLLDQPLRTFLPSPPPSLDTLPQAQELPLIQRFTGRETFCSSLTQGQNASVFLVLDPPPQNGSCK